MVGTLPSIYRSMHHNGTMLRDSLRSLPSASQVNHINSSLYFCVACLDKLSPTQQSLSRQANVCGDIGIVFFFCWKFRMILIQFTQSVMIGCSKLSQEYCKLIGLCLKLMERQFEL